MTNNEDAIKAVVREDYGVLSRCWSPYALVYNPLKVGSIDSTDVVAHDCGVSRALSADYRPDHRLVGNPRATVMVLRLPRGTTRDHLLAGFSEFGKVVRCRVVEDVVTGQTRGYGFVEYEREEEAGRAYRRGGDLVILGSRVGVDMECSRLLPGWVPRRLGGGFCGKKESGQLRFGCRYKPFKKPIQLMESHQLVSHSTTQQVSRSTAQQEHHGNVTRMSSNRDRPQGPSSQHR